MHAHDMHAPREMCPPMRCTPLRCTPSEIHSPMIHASEIHINKKRDREKCMPVRRCMHGRDVCLEKTYAYKRYVPARNACLQIFRIRDDLEG
jgi:hypothetical protein